MMHNLNISSSGDRHEGLSAFLDSEVSEAEGRSLLRELAGDAEGRERWAEYSLIGDALRGDLHVRPDFQKRFVAALEAEPTVLAPMPMRSRATRPAVWLAAAASVAAVSWTVWNAAPALQGPVPAQPQPELVVEAGEASRAMPYLVAHQDFSQAVIVQPEMRFSRVSLAVAEGAR